MTAAQVVDFATKMIPRRENRRVTSACAAILLLHFLAACGGPSTTPEAQLRDWVAAVEAAAESKDRDAILDLVADNYTDARGNTRDAAGDLLRLYFLRQNKILLATSIDEIDVFAGTAADMSVTVGMAGTNAAAFGIDADAYRFELELEARGGPSSYEDWQLISARWGALGRTLR
jgi:hypothetical protein